MNTEWDGTREFELTGLKHSLRLSPTCYSLAVYSTILFYMYKPALEHINNFHSEPNQHGAHFTFNLRAVHVLIPFLPRRPTQLIWLCSHSTRLFVSFYHLLCVFLSFLPICSRLPVGLSASFLLLSLSRSSCPSLHGLSCVKSALHLISHTPLLLFFLLLKEKKRERFGLREGKKEEKLVYLQ